MALKEIHIADSEEKILQCFDVMYDLRPHVEKNKLLSLIHAMQEEKYSIIYIEEDNRIVSFAGYRFITNLFSGSIIYVDDLGTLPGYRGKGFGGQLIDYIIAIAREKQLKEVHLDSGHHRFDAHRLYLNKGFKIESHHFALHL